MAKGYCLSFSLRCMASAIAMWKSVEKKCFPFLRMNDNLVVHNYKEYGCENYIYTHLNSERGNLVFAMTLAIFAVSTAITMAAMAFNDTIAVRIAADNIQEYHLLRSEAGRGEAVISKLTGLWDFLYLPIKKVQVNTSHSTNTYFMKSRISRNEGNSPGDDYFINGYKVSSLARVKRGTIHNFYRNSYLSPISNYAEKYLSPSSFATYAYFSDTDQTTNGTPNYFWGPDVIEGKVYSNSDIWIKQAGGGNNNGWPTFLGAVYTAGTIHSLPGNPPYAQVFRAGYFEHSSGLEFRPAADLIRAHAIIVGPASLDAPNPNVIMMVTINGNSYTALKGDIIERQDTTDVWEHFPPRSGHYLYRNRFSVKDTIWTNYGGGSISGHSALVCSKLWLRGSVTGKQTWGSTDTLYINDNLRYTGTNMGMDPDGNGSIANINRNDYLGVVSEKSILIQYGYKDPLDSLRYHPNCSSDYDGVFVYGALCALGSGEGDSHRDGVFSFEYQHPHPANPDQRVNNVYYSQIDLHKHKFPQTSSLRWPGGLDYPWYNPLWPERHPYMERGTVHVFGAISQRRAGYIHRSANDLDYPNPGNFWNIPIDFCGGPAGTIYNDPDLGIIGSGVNAPEATGTGVGYKKDYHYDSRFLAVSPPDFPMVRTLNGEYQYNNNGWFVTRPPHSF